MGPDRAGMGGELQGGVRAERGGLVHRHRQEGEEDGVVGGGGPQLVPRRRAGEGGPHRREPDAQEEEGAVQAQGQERLCQEVLRIWAFAAHCGEFFWRLLRCVDSFYSFVCVWEREIILFVCGDCFIDLPENIKNRMITELILLVQA